jgi:hypothetical protein
VEENKKNTPTIQTIENQLWTDFSPVLNTFELIFNDASFAMISDVKPFLEYC